MYLVKQKSNACTYAMKKISKSKMDPQKTLKYVRSEQKILSESASPFILKLRSSFQTQRCFYMVTQFAEAGDVARYLRIHGQFTEDTTRVLCAEILVALEYLHERNVVYGDLKPENVLLDGDGHVLLADFGLSWEEKEQASFQATDEFMAPEQVSGHAPNKAVDFWAFVDSPGRSDLLDAVGQDPLLLPGSAPAVQKNYECVVTRPKLAKSTEFQTRPSGSSRVSSANVLRSVSAATRATPTPSATLNFSRGSTGSKCVIGR